MGFSSFFSRQARRPTGLFGRFVASRLFDKGNAPLHDLAFETVVLGPKERLLEIGCGTGALLRRLADRTPEARLEGIDFSEPMADLARKNNKTHIKSGRVSIRLGDFHQADLETGAYDTVLTVNTVYFWKTPEAATAAIHGLLRPGGSLVLGFHQKADMESMPLSREVFSFYSLEEMEDLLATAFPREGIAIRSNRGKGKPCFCAVAAKAED